MKRAATDHPKMKHLARLIAATHKHQSKYALLIARGLMESLWHFTARYAPQGDIGKRSDEQIADGIGWPIEDANFLIRALIDAEWLAIDVKHRLIINDWHEHADKSVKDLLKRQGLAFACADLSALPVASSQKPVSTTVDARVDDPPFDTVGGDGATAEWGLTPEPPDPLESRIEETAEALKARHPAKRTSGVMEIRKKLRTIVQYRAALAKAPQGKKSDRQAWLLAMVNENHAAWCASSQWTRDDGEYAKLLANWLAPTEMRYLEPPAGPPPSQHLNGPDPRMIL